MTIIRTPRPWPGYDPRRRIALAGLIYRARHGEEQRDFSDIIRGAKIAVEARNNRGWGESRKQVVTHRRDRVEVEVVRPETGRVVGICWNGYQSLSQSDLTVRVEA